MRTFRILATLLLLAIPLPAFAQGVPDIAEPFKVGTFEIEGTPTVSLVLRDQLIVDIDAANTALQRDPYYARVQAPADMLELIERYEYGLQRRLYELVNHLVENNMLGAGRPSYVHDLGDVRTLPPILYPGKILNAAVNFYSHVNETGTEEERAEARRQRRENRGVPYLFLKPSKGAVIGDGGEVVLPWGRDRIDWEVELGAVIGRSAKYVSANDAEAFVFGYLVSLDISDRGGRPPGGNPMTSDWFVGKGHDTFAPQGPWIVPKEFYGNPMEILRQTLDVGDERMQEATAGDMIHSLWELIEYGSSIITLFPGDVVNNGTSGGVGMGTAVRGAQRFLQPGEQISASIDGIGTLNLSVVSEPEPQGLTGAHLPPVRTYRGPPPGGD
ncbi:MAG: fumarylacetoacetate hydrolase family protein [Gammaproteobacteria bacterium]|nr:fumarylacetoacetate hydrolase family protein [Gammaproteobacteria bacterium]MYF60729.1 fumarylacetoacetate hydrolase family protein [Gammaproteobacteria bacterium]MYI21675.1 fumarylacetoacetate hydrolase family protein [Gammaproteobacteria bacterium]